MPLRWSRQAWLRRRTRRPGRNPPLPPQSLLLRRPPRSTRWILCRILSPCIQIVTKSFIDMFKKVLLTLLRWALQCWPRFWSATALTARSRQPETSSSASRPDLVCPFCTGRPNSVYLLFLSCLVLYVCNECKIKWESFEIFFEGKKSAHWQVVYKHLSLLDLKQKPATLTELPIFYIICMYVYMYVHDIT